MEGKFRVSNRLREQHKVHTYEFNRFSSFCPSSYHKFINSRLLVILDIYNILFSFGTTADPLFDWLHRCASAR